MHSVLKRGENWGTRVFTKTIMISETWHHDSPQHPFEVTLEVDIDKLLAGLGKQAAKNKTKRSKQFACVAKARAV